ncbi:hypothetical protein [Ancylobacter lacus]|uniref:hypothetical protein n=1 Tax=Ancylobacter lacus TaxID=2579970 RepID=UPI001BCD8AC0|nr:hypothetical protein [Ancylobacter lacus]MBS7538694.1 hypothetical protein [Ancylobacter lacus]
MADHDNRSTETTTEAASHDAGRRDAMKGMGKLLAAAPIAALLFDAKVAEAAGDGSFE